MPLQLRSGVHHAIADGRNVFLDIERDRYFCLPPSLDHAFRAFLHTDCRDPHGLAKLIELGVLVADPDRHDPSVTLRPPLRSLPETDAAPAVPYIAIAVAAIRIKAAKWRQHRHSLRARLDELLNIAVADTDKASVGKLSRYVHTFQRAGLLTSTRDFCLPYSIMLTKFLRRRGFAAQLVIGVSGRPFAAHSWVQIDDMVINDTIDNISRFTPIVVA